MNSQFNRAFGWFTAILCLSCVAASFLYVTGCKSLDPALPGTTNAAPLVAFTNGSAYVLGHAVSSNQFYSVTYNAARLGDSLLIQEVPGASNYLADAQAVFQSLSGSGVYNASLLQSSLAAIPLHNASEQSILSSVVSEGVTLAGLYLGPLATGGTNAGPYIQAAFLALGNGL